MRSLGTFEVTSGRIRATDPCYSPSTWCAGEVKAKNGRWSAKIEFDDGRVASLTVRHIDHLTASPQTLSQIDVGVDSGQAGFFDAAKYGEAYAADKAWEEKTKQNSYGNLDTFYGKVCSLTSGLQGGAIEWGAVSSSGYGDGGYSLYFTEENGEVVAARVVFIGDDYYEDCDDYSDDYDYYDTDEMEDDEGEEDEAKQ